MKRFLWPIVCLLLIVVLLYSRVFFLTEEFPVEQENPEKQFTESQHTPLTLPASATNTKGDGKK